RARAVGRVRQRLHGLVVRPVGGADRTDGLGAEPGTQHIDDLLTVDGEAEREPDAFILQRWYAAVPYRARVLPPRPVDPAEPRQLANGDELVRDRRQHDVRAARAQLRDLGGAIRYRSPYDTIEVRPTAEVLGEITVGFEHPAVVLTILHEPERPVAD